MINNNRQIAFQKDVTTRQQGGAVVVTLPKQSHIKSLSNMKMGKSRYAQRKKAFGK